MHSLGKGRQGVTNLLLMSRISLLSFGVLQKAVAVCPQGSVILTGFAMSLEGGRAGPGNTVFLPCRAGQ